ncbi:pyridoxal phosphate-dependent aminotransferase [Chloroflexota bacterium]
MGIEPTEHVSRLVPYIVSGSAQLSLEDKSKFLKLDWNEATYPPSPLVKRRLFEFIEAGQLCFYPDVTAIELREKLSCYLGLEVSFIQAFNGSDAAIDAICATYVACGNSILVREPVYTQPYTSMQVRGANLVTFTGESPFDKVLAKYHAYLSNNAFRLVYIVNPNNPTGVLYEASEVQELLVAYPETLFVVDEAYSDYARTTVVGLVKDNNNLIVVRTFSKAFGLAGLRIGYVVSQPRIIDDLNRIRNGKEVNVMAQIAASATLDDLSYVEDRVNQVVQTRGWLVRNLREHGIECHETPANFILIRVPHVPEVIRRLAEARILVRDRSHLPQLEGYIRVTIGMPEEMKQFLDALKALPDSIIRHQGEK